MDLERIGRRRSALRRAGTGFLATLGLLVPLSGCQVPAPKPDQVWSACRDGLQDPGRAFETFRTAVQGNLLELEYRCFSGDWKARNGVSQVGYREFRDGLVREHPLLRYALYRAAVEVGEERGDRCTVLARYAGTTIRFELVREAFVEVRTDRRRVLSEPQGTRGALDWDPAQGAVIGWARVDPGEDLADLRELRLWSEWLIDDLAVLEDDVAP